jgi:hypothetical protein
MNSKVLKNFMSKYLAHHPPFFTKELVLKRLNPNRIKKQRVQD